MGGEQFAKAAQIQAQQPAARPRNDSKAADSTNKTTPVLAKLAMGGEFYSNHRAPPSGLERPDARVSGSRNRKWRELTQKNASRRGGRQGWSPPTADDIVDFPRGDFILGDPSPAPSRFVSMSILEIADDLASQEEYETEWWYYHGYLNSGESQYPFHVAFFRRRTDDVRIGSLLPLSWFGRQARFAHFGLTDLVGRRFWYGHQRSMFNHGGMLRDRYRVWIGNWSLEAIEAGHRVSVSIDGAAIDLLLSPLKPAVVHQTACGLCDSPGLPARYWSYTRMEAMGRLTVDGRSVEVTGTAWMDRAYGRLAITGPGAGIEGWDWFGIQLDDGRELMLHRFREFGGASEGSAFATLINGDGDLDYLPQTKLLIAPTSYWTSPRTGVRYPTHWKVRASDRGIELTITPFLRIHELDTRGTTCLTYWEGPSDVVGTIDGSAVSGRCFIELVGYDRRQAPQGCFDFTSVNLSWLDLLSSEFRFWRSRAGTLTIDGTADMEPRL